MHPVIAPDPAAILMSRDLDVVPFAQRIADLADRLGVDFSSTLLALSVIPLGQSRAEHPDLRRTIAGMIAAQSETLRPAIPGMVARHLEPLLQPGRIDMMPEVISPLVSDMISGLIGMRFDGEKSGTISRVFSHSIGVAKRRRLEAELAELTTSLRQAFPEADEKTIGLKVALAILGRDALLGTLGCSLWAVIDAAPGRAIGEMSWPDLPPRTGVPYIDRIALCPVKIGDADLVAGDSVRAQLSDYETAADQKARLSFFGAGAHLCLGRALSLELWREMARFLQKSAMTARVEAFGLRRDDVFHIPETFILELDLA